MSCGLRTRCPPDVVDYAALRRDEVERLERFATAFEAVDPLVYETYGVVPVDDDVLEQARQAAMRAIGSGSARREAAKAAVKRFVDAADRAIADRREYPSMIFAGKFSSPRAVDRAGVLQSLERAVVGIIVWDDLTQDERDILLGPWTNLAESALLG